MTRDGKLWFAMDIQLVYDLEIYKFSEWNLEN